ncbi:MAG: NAD(P)-dependent glycerol-3-phosphate dehydrogenase [Proteobacteria bacterium]|jgi:glycerol-3-phosphate dehydrogenase (NAD(P)+)|nr:NAD(P)-dependent glycerol-3-phosphate dehydrogenase [Pseudomonadota bacterium]MDA0941593.1 NAD(P)-dependent glycerol-3-phosphate dehydrogenase [Pseudomonadota bacterium]MDA1034427.1 NAD(P)-dependent glycerol-3-phosphate dehydrogenase [Pseudomonadota bacterium]
MNVAVLGAGAWGTALAIQAAKKVPVILWARDSGHISGMQKARTNPKYLGDFKFPVSLKLSASLDEAVNFADIIISAVPTSAFASLVQNVQSIDSKKPIIWVNKGLEKDTGLFPHEILKKFISNTGLEHGVLSGPSFAAELVRNLPTAVTVAASSKDLALKVAEIFHHHSMRIYLSDDIAGVSISGALKNIIAIAAGISDGMGFGNNARAALITRGIAEMTRFGVSHGAKEDTFMGLAGIGDLMLTCTGQYSRNREVGLLLAEGKILSEILLSLGHVAEGVNACYEVNKRIKSDFDMPIVKKVFQVLTNKISAAEAVKSLLSRSLRPEN